MFLTVEDFSIEPYLIPNLDKRLANFKDFIIMKEKEVLTKIFGPLFYNSFKTGLATDPVHEKWTRLRDGYFFEYDANPYGWVGIKEVLKPYVYSEWLDANTKLWSGVGMILPISENGESVSPADASWRAWNEFKKRSGYNEYYYSDVGSSLYGYINYANTVEPDYYYRAIYSEEFESKNPWQL